MITLTINGKEVHLEQPATVLEAARGAGIHIPTLCHHEELEAYGGCRLCLVEVEKMPKLQPACMLQVADGMVVRTESDAVVAARRGILELLLINHPLDCPYCDKAGECELQDAVARYGPTAGRFGEAKRRVAESHADPLIARNMERCILCLRCVRMCSGVQGASAISVVNRGSHSRIEPFSGAAFDCEYCGNCISVCPVGALLSRLSFHNYRPWAIDREVTTVCGFCGVGCSFVVQARDQEVTRVSPKFGLGLNDGLLCSRGRFGYPFRASAERLKEPLLRRNGRLEKATWDEALGFVARRLQDIRENAGASAIAGIASPRCTNEDNYVFQKFLRKVCGTDHIDSASRLGFAAAQKYIEAILGEGVSANRISDLRTSDVIAVVGGDPTAVNPILGVAVRNAVRNGASLAVIGDARGLERFKTLTVTPPVFREAEALESLVAKLLSAKGRPGTRPALDERIAALARRSSPADLPEAELGRVADMLLAGKSIAIVSGTDIVARTDGHRSLFAIAGLVYLTEAHLYLLSEKPNEQGLLDMGCRPETGMTLLEILDAVRTGTVRALYVMGENPAVSLPGSKAVRETLSGVDLLVVQDLFLTETAELAHVVLPAAAWSEKEGTFTNLERRIQRVRKAVNPPFGREDWRIVADISARMGQAMRYSSAEDVMAEISEVVPLYRGLTYHQIEGGECLWPYHASPSPPADGPIPPAPESQPEYPAGLYLAIDKRLFHSGTLSRRAPGLMKVDPEPALRIGKKQAEALGLVDGERVQVFTTQGSLGVPVLVEEGIRDGRVYLSNHFPGKGVFELLSYRMDEITKAAGLEGCAVRIDKVAG